MHRPLLRQQLLIISATIISTMVIVSLNAVLAAPSQNPPAGNPAFPAGPTGPQGPQGNQGNQGNQGGQGPTGPQGAQGPVGSAYCSWNNNMYINHGFDAYTGCQGYRGILINCSGNRTYSFYIVPGSPCGKAL